MMTVRDLPYLGGERIETDKTRLRVLSRADLAGSARSRFPGKRAITGAATSGSRQEADMTFPNPPVATVRVCRITQRDSDQRG